MNLYEKINAIMSEVKSLKKDGKVNFNNTKYNFLSEAKTTEVFREQLVKYKLVLLPISVEETIEGRLTHGIYRYRLIDVENPQDYIELMTSGQGHDTADKGSGKASSYAYKYLLWRTFAVPSNDDPDNISSDEIMANSDERNMAMARLLDLAKAKGIPQKTVNSGFMKKFGVPLSEATKEQILSAITGMENKANDNHKQIQSAATDGSTLSK